MVRFELEGSAARSVALVYCVLSWLAAEKGSNTQRQRKSHQLRWWDLGRGRPRDSRRLSMNDPRARVQPFVGELKQLDCVVDPTSFHICKC